MPSICWNLLFLVIFREILSIFVNHGCFQIPKEVVLSDSQGFNAYFSNILLTILVISLLNTSFIPCPDSV